MIRKVIVFKHSGPFTRAIPAAYLETLDQLGAVDIQPLPLVGGVSCSLPERRAILLNETEQIRSIEDDVYVRLGPILGVEQRMETSKGHQIVPRGISRIGAETAWRSATGDRVRVAVMDTGIDVSHQDLAVNVKGGINLVEAGQLPDDDHGHGTHIAGTIAAADNRTGVIGVAPEAHLYSIKVLDRNGSAPVSRIIMGLSWCVEHHMQVVNMSFGLNQPSQALAEAVKSVAAAGVIMIAAAGNGGGHRSVEYPAAYRETVAVGAITGQGTLARFSSQGPELTLVAPGTEILSTTRRHSYRRLSGTSMATAHVTGTACLILQHNSRLGPGDINLLLQSSAERLPLIPKDKQGAGLVRADRAMANSWE